MSGAVFFTLLFLTCWLVLLVNRIAAFRNKSKLNSQISILERMLFIHLII